MALAELMPELRNAPSEAVDWPRVAYLVLLYVRSRRGRVRGQVRGQGTGRVSSRIGGRIGRERLVVGQQDVRRGEALGGEGPEQAGNEIPVPVHRDDDADRAGRGSGQAPVSSGVSPGVSGAP